MSLPRLEQSFVVGSVQTLNGSIPQVSFTLTREDRLGTFKARWGVGRMNYKVEPGLYALGHPNHQAPVLVTANYKMSFDKLREALPGRNIWILVLDTKGINVWCAAGKGTFGTDELVGRVASSGLTQVVSHRELILPQLAGPGVSAHEVRKRSGFRVIYGPIQALDLPGFLDAGLKATPEMRRKTFTTRERMMLIPVELVEAMKKGFVVMAFLFLLAVLARMGNGWADALNHGLFSAGAILTALLSGAVLSPLLLPWLPGRAFSIKGLSIGLVAAVILLAARWSEWTTLGGRIEMAAWLLLIPAISAFLAMNFTGASILTSLSGVRKEMRWAVPFQIGAAVVGLTLWVGSNFFG